MITNRVNILRAIAFIILVLSFGCSRNIPDPISPPIIDTVPPTPVNLEARVGDRVVNLSWDVADTQLVTNYCIYLADSSGQEYSKIGEAGERSYAASNLQNGLLYHFRASSKIDGFEGYKSEPISAVPNLYGIFINGGNEFTNVRDVILTLTAPLDTRLMQISSDSSFADSQWESFAAERGFRLPGGDGQKTVFCRFRDYSDAITIGYFSYTITLDSEASIDSVRFMPSGAPFSPGENIHFMLFAGEADGEAALRIGDGLLNLILFDNGERGDVTADDGIYELDYTITSSLDFENQIVYGEFVDRAGNSSDDKEADESISIRRPPDPVTIYGVNPPEGYFDRLDLNWSRSGVTDFAQYRIYRGDAAGVDSSDHLVHVVMSAATTTITDTDLSENMTYYYVVYVLDITGLWSCSNEASAATNQNQAPDPVELYPVVATPGRHDRLELSWSETDDVDFLRYELYRSYDNSVDTLDILLLSSDSQVSYADTGLASDSVYYYAVLARDQAGNSSWSNTEAGYTNPDESPERPTLFPVVVEPDHYEDVALEWNQSTDIDFESYSLFRWQEDVGRDDSAMVALITDAGTTIFTDHPPFNTVEDTIDFWYILYVHDRGGNSAGSDSIMVRLIDDVPDQVSGSVAPSDSSLIVTWSRSDIPDFASYRLLRDIDSDPTGALTIFVTADQESVAYDDSSTVESQTYFYWLDIYDLRNNSSRSTLGSGSW